MSTEVNLPEFLYKFRCWSNELHRTALTERALFFASFDKLNDPWDSRIPLRYDKMHYKERLRYILELWRQFEGQDFTEVPIEQAEMMAKNMANRDYVEFYNDKLIESKKSQYGILSFAGVLDSRLMWSHYAESHAGLCLEFRGDVLLERFNQYFAKTRNSIRQVSVNYKSYPTVIPCNEDHDFYLDVFKYKAEDWAYEKEYRFILHGESNIPLHYTPEALSKVILGCAMPDHYKLEVDKIARIQFPQCEVYEAKTQFGCFDLKYEPFSRNS